MASSTPTLPAGQGHIPVAKERKKTARYFWTKEQEDEIRRRYSAFDGITEAMYQGWSLANKHGVIPNIKQFHDKVGNLKHGSKLQPGNNSGRTRVSAVDVDQRL